MRKYKFYLLFLIISSLCVCCAIVSYKLIECKDNPLMPLTYIEEFDRLPLPVGAKVDPQFTSSDQRSYLIKTNYESFVLSYISGLVVEGWKVELAVSFGALKIEKDHVQYSVVVGRTGDTTEGLCRISVSPIKEAENE
jgi:hypothetical protein